MDLDLAVDALLGGCLAGIIYLLAGAYAVRRFKASISKPATVGYYPPVTVLKPVCGDEPGLYENLRSFCEQDYADVQDVQIVFGAAEEMDPAVGVVRRLIRDLPWADLTLVVDGRIEGRNRKISNLVKMVAKARHDVLVVADSDMRVRPDYLRRVVGTLADPGVGLATCLYVGRPVGGLWSALCAMGINYGFLPSVLVGRMLGASVGCFGATMAIPRDSFERIGGFDPVRDLLAEDYALGAAIQGLGRRVAIAPYVVDNIVFEPSFRSLFRHELRWARTIRSIAPLEYAVSVVTNPVALAILAVVLTGLESVALILLALALLCREIMVRVVERVFGLARAPRRLVPLRDLLSLIVLVVSFMGRKVVWRDHRFRVDSGGRLVAESDSAP